MNQSYSSCESPDGIHLSPTYLVKFWTKRQSSHGYQNKCPKGPFLYHLECCFWWLHFFVLENNKPPQADAGPDKELTLPVDSTTLDGSKSTDDQRIVSYLWEKTQWVFCAEVPGLGRARFYLFFRLDSLLLAYSGEEKVTFIILNFSSLERFSDFFFHLKKSVYHQSPQVVWSWGFCRSIPSSNA